MQPCYRLSEITLRRGHTIHHRSDRKIRWFVKSGILWVTQPNGRDEIYRSGDIAVIGKDAVGEALSEEAIFDFEPARKDA